MNRETLRAMRIGRTSSKDSKNAPHCLSKERCVVWIKERGQYLRAITCRMYNGKAVRAIDTCASAAQAAVFEGDRATRIAEQIMLQGMNPVLRSHYVSQV